MVFKTDVVDTPGHSPCNNDSNSALHDRPAFKRLQIEDGDPSGRGINHSPAIRRIRVVVEVETGASGFVAQANNAMARIRIDPCLGWCLRLPNSVHPVE